MSQRVDVIRRPPIGKSHVIAENVTIAEAGRLINSRQADVWWPLGLARAMKHVARLVLLNEKRPIMQNWPEVVISEKDVERHVLVNGGNIGMRCGNGLAVLDFDDTVAETEMQAKYGKLEPTVITGSGKRHYYFRPPDDCELPAKIRWEGKIVGEVQRTSAQQVVCPPSVHPITQQAYVWAGGPKDLAPLPDVWLKALLAEAGPRTAKAATPSGDMPAYIKMDDKRGHEANGGDWTGPDAIEISRRAMLQPGARVRAGGVKFQCPGCRAEGHDKHRDNAVVRLDGRWGCAVNPLHKRAIGEALSIKIEKPLAEDPALTEAPLGTLPEYPLLQREETPEYPLLEDVE